MNFTKMHGTGNDFLVIDARAFQRVDWARLAVALCDRHFGVGGDGIILVLDSQSADYRMRMFNPDGSEAEMCGNGIRCFGRYLYERGLTEKTRLSVETGAGVLELKLLVESQRVVSVTVSMGEPRLAADAIPVTLQGERVVDFPLEVAERSLKLTLVSMGNPHAVAFVDDVQSFPLTEIGPLVERHPLFPRRTNFEIVRVVSEDELEVRVWERGAGTTLACGTGACASVVAAKLKGLVDDVVHVNLPGGALSIRWPGSGPVVLTGPAEFVFEGRWLREVPRLEG